MRTLRYIIPMCVLLVAGCGQKQLGDVPLSEKKISFGLKALNGVGTRAVVDEWDETPVSIAYVYAPETIFDRSLTVTVTDGSGEYINTGLEYPMTDTDVSFIGYHPVAAPGSAGSVDFNISGGDVDVMMSNTLKGSYNTPISNNMVFEHLLTRFVFLMQCKVNETYPELVCGVSVGANPAHTTESLMNFVTLDLNSGASTFKVPMNSVFCGSSEGVMVPQNLGAGGGIDPLAFDVMVQPGIPLFFEVVTQTDRKTINMTSDPNGLWQQITEGIGGEPGKQYTIKLAFSGEGILFDGITASPWLGNKTISSGTWF